MSKQEIFEIVKEIQTRRFEKLSRNIIDENDLLSISSIIKEDEKAGIRNLLSAYTFTEVNDICDWNIGSILQHFDYNNIIECMKEIPVNMRAYLYDSIGLTWSLGECPYINDYIIDFLYEILNYSRNSEAWWRSAFALEKMTGKNAINNLKRSLKNYKIPTLKECFSDLSDKRNVIGILLNSNNNVIKNEIYPKLKEKYDKCTNELELINIIWLFGRLRLYDDDIYSKILNTLSNSTSYELTYYIFQSMIDDPKKLFMNEFKKNLKTEDNLIKKMAIDGLAEIGSEADAYEFEKMLDKENDSKIVSSLSQAIYKIRNSDLQQSKRFIQKYMVNENGLIGDDSDKWYADAAIYNQFSEAEDVENLCFKLIFNRILAKKLEIKNPVDLATGTGKTAKYLLNNVNYAGTLYAVDFSQQMLDYFSRTIDRQKYYVKNIELVHSTIEDFKMPNNEKTNLIISSFGFPSKISDGARCNRELENVYEMLDDDGLFITLGWDETFNDELNAMWYKYIPDNIVAKSFEEWRAKRETAIETPRNCNLSWYKTNLKVPLIYDTLEESINVMGHLFGRDAALEVLKKRQTKWWMSMGITWDSKKTLKRILEKRK